MRFKNLVIVVVALYFAMISVMADENQILGHTVMGAGDEKVIVLHDWMGDSKNYDTVIPWLDSRQFTYVFADVRGYGLSREIAGSYNTDEVASDILRLADHLGWESFHLVGHSMTGMAGFKALLTDWKSGRRIKSYVATTPATPDGYPASNEDKVFLAATMTDDATAVAAFGALTGGKLNNAWMKRKTKHSRESSEPTAVKGYYNMWLNEDFSSALIAAKVQTPVLVIGGRNDLPGFQQDYFDKTLAAWLPNVEFEYIDNAGHYPMQETPILFATLVERHFVNSAAHTQ